MSDVKKNKVFFGKVLKKNVTTKAGEQIEINNLLTDNPLPLKKDGSPDPYHKGQLIWRDTDGNEFLIKQATFGGVSDKSAQYGFTRSLSVDLDDAYQAQKLK